jgi:hypothetical protein
MEAPLNIALAQTPARQTTWRVVRIVASMFSAWLLVLAGYRLCFAWNSVVPSEGSVHLRIPKSPTTIANLRTLTNGVEVISGIPWSVDALLQTSHRVLNIGFEGDGSTVIVIDRALNAEEQLAFANFGAVVTVREDETVITDAPTEKPVEHHVLYGFTQTLFTLRDATLTGGGNTFGISLHSDQVTIHGFSGLAAPTIDSEPTSDTLLFASFGQNDLRGLSERVFTQNTPGLANFFTVAAQNGLSANIHGATGALSYTFATPITEETRDLVSESSLRALAEELTEIPTIDGITDFLDDGSKTIALRSREDATVVLRDESPYRFLTATSSAGSVTITETPTYLTVSNATIASGAPATPSCLSGATAFAKPVVIRTLLPERAQYEAQTLSSFLWRATTIASTANTTRICIVD